MNRDRNEHRERFEGPDDRGRGARGYTDEDGFLAGPQGGDDRFGLRGRDGGAGVDDRGGWQSDEGAVPDRYGAGYGGQSLGRNLEDRGVTGRYGAGAGGGGEARGGERWGGGMGTGAGAGGGVRDDMGMGWRGRGDRTGAYDFGQAPRDLSRDEAADLWQSGPRSEGGGVTLGTGLGDHGRDALGGYGRFDASLDAPGAPHRTWRGGLGEPRARPSRGPKNYVRSDARLHEDVCEAIGRDDDLDASGVEVKVEEGVVTLTGRAPDRATQRRVEDIAESVAGVREVRNEVRVRREA